MLMEKTRKPAIKREEAKVSRGCKSWRGTRFFRSGYSLVAQAVENLLPPHLGLTPTVPRFVNRLIQSARQPLFSMVNTIR